MSSQNTDSKLADVTNPLIIEEEKPLVVCPETKEPDNNEGTITKALRRVKREPRACRKKSLTVLESKAVDQVENNKNVVNDDNWFNNSPSWNNSK